MTGRVPTIKFTREDDDGNELELELPARYEVCDRCGGEGNHNNPNIDGNGITASEWAEDWDDDSREAYVRGDYQVPCEDCHGVRVVAVVDEEHCNPDLLKEYLEQEEQRARWDYDDRMTRRQESGGRW